LGALPIIRSAQNPGADRIRLLCRATVRSQACRYNRAEGCVAVGFALGHRLGADRAAGAGPVIDDDAFAKQLAHLVGDHPPDDRGAAAGRERDDQRNGPVRKVCAGASSDAPANPNATAAQSTNFQTRILREPPGGSFILLGRIVVESSGLRNPRLSRAFDGLFSQTTPNAGSSGLTTAPARLMKRRLGTHRTCQRNWKNPI